MDSDDNAFDSDSEEESRTSGSEFLPSHTSSDETDSDDNPAKKVKADLESRDSILFKNLFDPKVYIEPLDTVSTINFISKRKYSNSDSESDSESKSESELRKFSLRRTKYKPTKSSTKNNDCLESTVNDSPSTSGVVNNTKSSLDRKRKYSSSDSESDSESKSESDLRKLTLSRTKQTHTKSSTKNNNCLESTISAIPSSSDIRNNTKSKRVSKLKSKKNKSIEEQSDDSLSDFDPEKDLNFSDETDSEFVKSSQKKTKNISNHSIELSDNESSSSDIELCEKETKSKRKKKISHAPSLLNQSLGEGATLSEQSSFDLTLDINLKSVGPVLQNKKNEIAPRSNEGCKKNCCIFCLREKILTENETKKVLFTKLVEHYETAHSEERIIKKLEKIPKEKLTKNKEPPKNFLKRLKILDMLRNKANHLNNLTAKDAKDFVLRRRAQAKYSNTISMYKPCYKCKQRCSVKSMHKHVRYCTGKTFAKKRLVRSSARATDGDYHPIATEEAIRIISKMRESEAVDAIRFDETIFVWLNAEASRFEVINQRHNHKSVKASISRLGTLFLFMQKFNPEIQQFSDIFHETHYDNFIKAVKLMGKPDKITKFMQAPATANDMFNLIQKVSSIYDVTMCSKDKTKRSEVQEFDKKLKTMWHFNIGNTIAETQAHNRRHKVKPLPTSEDISTLNNYLLKKMDDAYEALKIKYSDKNYEALRDSTAVYLELTNCRRPGEVERMTDIDYGNKQVDSENCRIQLRGKRSKPVPVVFPVKILNYLQLLDSCRPLAGILKGNPFMFATIHDVSSNDFSTISACKLMTAFAKMSGAENPNTLKATLIRQHLATDQFDKGISEHGVEKLSGYMGHTPKIHRQNYRKSRFEHDIQMYKSVQKSQGLSKQETTQTKVHKNLPSVQEEIDTIADGNISDNILTDTTNELIPNAHVSNPSKKKKRKVSATSTNFVAESVPDATNDSSPNAHVSNAAKKKKAKVSATSTSFVAESVPGPKHTKTPWLEPQILLFLNRFPNALDPDYKLPTGQEIQSFIDSTTDPVLAKRTEPQIRIWLHGQRKTTQNDSALPLRNNVPGYIYVKFEQYIAVKKIPSHTTCAKFLASSTSNSNTTIKNIQDWVALAIKRKSK